MANWNRKHQSVDNKKGKTGNLDKRMMEVHFVENDKVADVQAGKVDGDVIEDE